MNPSNNSSFDYSIFGGTKIEEEEKPIQIAQPSEDIQINNTQQKIDYSQFGGSPVKEKEKTGKAGSILYGLAESVLGLPGLIQYGVNEWSKGLEKAFNVESPNLTPEQENPIMSLVSSFPESEDEASRRLRAGTVGVVGGLPFGIPGILAGLVGSQAGQTIREVYGKDGKFENFGWGELSAIATDIVTGAGTGIGTNVLRSSQRATQSTIPAVFREPSTRLERAVVKNAVQNERNNLQNIVNSFSQNQISGFEQQVSQISPDRFTQLINSNASALKRNADNMFRNTQLSIISPIAATPEQGGRAIQEAANTVFQDSVITAEREAYNLASEAAKDISGEAPRTLEQAKALRNELVKSNPTPEQQPLVNFLNGLISDLETNIPANITPASKLVNSSGRPLTEAVETAARTEPRSRNANDLVDLVQRSNQAVNYESELRQQSHRLIPLLRTFRTEVGDVLGKKPIAKSLYQDANDLHATNAEIWGTKYMRNVRFAENPEKLVGQTKQASNMRNLKQGIQDPAIQALAERLVIEQITEGGSSSANRIAVNKIAPELSLNARNASEQLIQVKDPLTNSGGRAAVRNDILKDAAQAVNTGKRPEKILDLMQTPKGLALVRESLNGTPESRRLLRSFERLFIEDIFNSITDHTGMIDFKKARSIIKNNDVRQVIENIGGRDLVTRFTQLEGLANNFERNLTLYKSPETQSFFQKLAKESKSAGLIGAVLHALHVPLEIIGLLGLTKATAATIKGTSNVIKDKVLSNPRAVNILESISRATTTQELLKQVPRLIVEIEKKNEND